MVMSYFNGSSKKMLVVFFLRMSPLFHFPSLQQTGGVISAKSPVRTPLGGGVGPLVLHTSLSLRETASIK